MLAHFVIEIISCYFMVVVAVIVATIFFGTRPYLLENEYDEDTD